MAPRPANLMLALLPLLASTAFAASASDWAQRSIYQLVTDRFAKTTDDGGPCDSAARQYCGGTWQGIINHLDYIQGMGFDAVWISPVVENIEGNTTYGAAYHGYWPLNFNALNSHFGTAADLKSLSDALHKRGMYLMLDVIINHVAATSIPPSLTYSGYAPYSDAADYHDFCWITDYTNQTQVEQCWVGDSNVALADLDTESQTVIDGHAAWVKQLVSDYAADGLRIDTAKHVRQSFYPDFLSAAGVFAVAEILDLRANYTGAYTDYIDSTFNYPQWFKLCTAFQNTQADMSVLVQSFKDTQTYFKNGGVGSTVSFSENHDNARLPAMIPDPVLVKNIITWTFVGDGIPTLYYGQEASYSGGNDPMNREALWFTSYSTDVALYPYITKLNAARKLALNTASSKGTKDFATTAASIASSTNQHIAIQKYPLLGVFTNSGNASMAQWTVAATIYKANTTLVDVASDGCDTVTVANDGSVPIQFKLGNPKVYLPATSLSSSGVCGSKAEAASTDSGALPSARGSVMGGVLAAGLVAALLSVSL